MSFSRSSLGTKYGADVLADVAVLRKQFGAGGAAGLFGGLARILAQRNALGGGHEGGNTTRRAPLPCRSGA